MMDKICPKCEGTGLINYEHTCTVCNGEGVVSSDMMSRDQLVELDVFNNIIEIYRLKRTAMYGNFPSGLIKQLEELGSNENLTEYQRALGRMIRPNGLRTTERIKSVYEEDDTHSR